MTVKIIDCALDVDPLDFYLPVPDGQGGVRYLLHRCFTEADEIVIRNHEIAPHWVRHIVRELQMRHSIQGVPIDYSVRITFEQSVDRSAQ